MIMAQNAKDIVTYFDLISSGGTLLRQSPETTFVFITRHQKFACYCYLSERGPLLLGFYRSLVATMTVTQVNAHKSDG